MAATPELVNSFIQSQIDSEKQFSELFTECIKSLNSLKKVIELKEKNHLNAILLLKKDLEHGQRVAKELDESKELQNDYEQYLNEYEKEFDKKKEQFNDKKELLEEEKKQIKEDEKLLKEENEQSEVRKKVLDKENKNAKLRKSSLNKRLNLLSDEYEHLKNQYDSGILFRNLMSKKNKEIEHSIYGSLGKYGKVFGGGGFISNMKMFSQNPSDYTTVVAQNMKDYVFSPFKKAFATASASVNAIKFAARLPFALFRTNRESAADSAINMHKREQEKAEREKKESRFKTTEKIKKKLEDESDYSADNTDEDNNEDILTDKNVTNSDFVPKKGNDESIDKKDSIHKKLYENSNNSTSFLKISKITNILEDSFSSIRSIENVVGQKFINYFERILKVIESPKTSKETIDQSNFNTNVDKSNFSNTASKSDSPTKVKPIKKEVKSDRQKTLKKFRLLKNISPNLKKDASPIKRRVINNIIKNRFIKDAPGDKKSNIKFKSNKITDVFGKGNKLNSLLKNFNSLSSITKAFNIKGFNKPKAANKIKRVSKLDKSNSLGNNANATRNKLIRNMSKSFTKGFKGLGSTFTKGFKGFGRLFSKGMFGGSGLLGRFASFGSRLAPLFSKILLPLIGVTMMAAGAYTGAKRSKEWIGKDNTEGKVISGVAGALAGKGPGIGEKGATAGAVAKNIGKGALKGAAIGMLFGPWGALIGAGVGAVFAAIGGKRIAQFLNWCWEGIKSFFSLIWKGLKKVWEGIKWYVDFCMSIWKKVWDGVKYVFNIGINNFKKAWEFVKSIFDSFVNTVNKLWNSVKSFFGFGEEEKLADEFDKTSQENKKEISEKSKQHKSDYLTPVNPPAPSSTDITNPDTNSFASANTYRANEALPSSTVVNNYQTATNDEAFKKDLINAVKESKNTTQYIPTFYQTNKTNNIGPVTYNTPGQL